LQPDDYFLIAMFLGAFYVLRNMKNSLELEKELTPNTKVAIACGIAFVFCLFGMNRITEFLYFKF
jgi:hypothetical protein